MSIIGRVKDALTLRNSANDRLKSDLETIQGRIRQCASEIREIENAFVDAETARLRAENLVVDLGRAAKRGLSNALAYPDFNPAELQTRLCPPMLRGTSGGESGQVLVSTPNPSAMQMLAFVNPAGLTNAMMVDFVSSTEGQKTLSLEVRPEMIAALRAEADDLERMEEKLIREAEAGGLRIRRRLDASPEIMLAFDSDLA